MYSAQQLIQKTVFQKLNAIDELNNLIFDTVPSYKHVPETYVVIGTDTLSDNSSKTHQSVKGLFEVNVYSKHTGLSNAKNIADIIVDDLVNTQMHFSPASLVVLAFKGSKVQRLRQGALHLIKLQFHIILDTTKIA